MIVSSRDAGRNRSPCLSSVSAVIDTFLATLNHQFLLVESVLSLEIKSSISYRSGGPPQ